MSQVEQAPPVGRRDATAAGEPAMPRRRSRRGCRLLRLSLARLAVLAAFCGLWELASRTVVKPFWVGRPSAIADQLGKWAADGTLWTQLSPTLTEALLGFVLGGAAGALVGFAFGSFPAVGRLLNPFVTAVYTLPKIALAPLIILWFGIGTSSKVVLAALLVFFLVFFNTYSGVRQVDRDLLDAVRLMNASRWELARYVVLPNAATWVFVGLRISLPYALIGAVVGEMLASNRGIGYLLVYATNQFDTIQAFAVLTVLMIVGAVLNAIVEAAEARSQRWQPQNLDARMPL